MEVDGVKRPHTAWPDWAVSARIDASEYWDMTLDAIACHRTQVAEMIEALRALPATHDPRILSEQTFSLAFSLVNGGRGMERELFEGIR